MSCLDVMYHQSYGAHYLPTAAYKATYYNHHHQDPGAISARRSMLHSELKDGTQPAEAEYLGSRCVLFTYFQGNIGDVVDEHFSRALSQSSTFNSETKPIRVTQPSASGQSSSVWNSTYPPQASPCLPSVSVHPDFTSSPVSFNHPDGSLWADHVLSQGGFPTPATLPESWTYSLSPQSSSSYPSVHNVYHPHAHIHPRHHHPMLHSYPTHGPALDPRFNPLLLPGVRNQNQPTASSGSSPHSEGVKTEVVPSSNTLDHQTKGKTSVWF
uniref:Uncharacterized protein n=1 Tax=Mola mola TaxID=94237 RepID=A0A3Q3W6S1_MOLML